MTLCFSLFTKLRKKPEKHKDFTQINSIARFFTRFFIFFLLKFGFENNF